MNIHTELTQAFVIASSPSVALSWIQTTVSFDTVGFQLPVGATTGGMVLSDLTRCSHPLISVELAVFLRLIAVFRSLR